jgi:2-desacetyl-2-hydroxyethyl bacteriochlorophyllide A dehydrogenase
MRAVRNAPPTVEVIETDDPEGEGELIRVAAAGICASDLMYLEYGSREIAGHEFAGTLQDGTPVAVEALFGCESCGQCEQGNYNRCEVGGPTALGMLQAGGMSEFFIAPRRAVRRLPSGLDVKDGCLVEPASVALHGCHAGQVGPDTSVAVVGAGAIGILAAAGVQNMGGSEVALEARHPHQHEARERIGAEEPADHYDVVIETAGSESGLHRAVELARPGGTVIHVGVYGDISWPHGQAFTKEVGLRPSLGYASHNGRREFSEAADMLARRPELGDILITHRYPMQDAPEAFRVAKDRSQGVFRVVVEF